jgi:hypothetical protein
MLQKTVLPLKEDVEGVKIYDVTLQPLNSSAYFSAFSTENCQFYTTCTVQTERQKCFISSCHPLLRSHSIDSRWMRHEDAASVDLYWHLENNLSQCHCAHHKSQMVWNWNQVSVMTYWWLGWERILIWLAKQTKLHYTEVKQYSVQHSNYFIYDLNISWRGLSD